MDHFNRGIILVIGGAVSVGSVSLLAVHKLAQERDDYRHALEERLLAEPAIRWHNGQATVPGPNGETLVVMLRQGQYTVVNVGAP